SISNRLEGLSQLHLLLASNYIGSELIQYKETLIDLLMRTIKRTDEECIVGSQLLAILAIQLGDDLSENMFDILPHLCSIMTDSDRCAQTRSKAALSIGISAFFSCDSGTRMRQLIRAHINKPG
ncbi:hypothetical protein PENTCL1PPCAC_12724, partial [Pristionchus entomophagus]